MKGRVWEIQVCANLMWEEVAIDVWKIVKAILGESKGFVPKGKVS